MATKRIIVHIDDEEVEIELKSAKKGDGLFRGELMEKAVKMDLANGRSMVGFYLYPTCLAAVKVPLWIRDMSLDDFIDRVDEVDMDRWTEEAYVLNPQWKANLQMLAQLGTEVLDDEQSKKTGTPLNGLTTPTQDLVETSQPLKN